MARNPGVSGRPTLPLGTAADELRFIGAKLTSDRIHAVLTDVRAEVVAERSEPIGVRTPEGVAAQAGVLMNHLARADERPAAAGFTMGGGFPGGDGRTPALFVAPWLDWWQVPLESVLREAMGIPCVVHNDVFSLARGQHWSGLARGIADFAVVAAGPGIGYALCLNGSVPRMTENDVVIFGHHILDPEGPPCPVGHRGRAAVAGETTDLIRGEHAAVEEGLRRRRARFPGSLSTTLLSSSFTEWARGGAVEAIRAFAAPCCPAPPGSWPARRGSSPAPRR